MDSKPRVSYFSLFINTFILSAFTFGGGYVIISLMKGRFVDKLGWLQEDDMLNITALAQSAPGPMAINASILLGYRTAGIPGGFVAVFGTVLPPLIIISIISTFYTAFRDNAVVGAAFRGMQAGVAAVICDVVYGMGSSVVKGKDIISIAIMIAAFIAVYFLNVNILSILLIGGALGVIRTFMKGAKT